MMDLAAFKASLEDERPPATLTGPLSALWYAGKGDWKRAHAIAQDIETKDGYWVHAYLHRQEGDPGNAGYWYGRAGQKMPSNPFEKEWESIAIAFLEIGEK